MNARQSALWTTVRTLVVAVCVMAVATVLTALLPWLGHRDIALAVFRAREAERAPDPEILEQLRRSLNLPSSPAEGVWQWVSGALQGDFGVSWVNPARSAAAIAWEGLGVSLTLTTLAMVVAVVGAWALVWPRVVALSRGGRPVMWHVVGMAIVGSIPSFVLAVVLLVIFGVRLRWLPVSGFSSVAHMVLPALALGIPSAGLLGRVALIVVDGIAEEEWVRSWRINGVGQRRIVSAISRRVAAVLAGQVALFFVGMLASTALVESTFGIAGFGQAALQAALNHDVPVLQVVVLTVLCFGMVGGALAHLARRLLLGPLGQGAEYAATASAHSRPDGTWVAAVALAPVVVVMVGLVRGSDEVNLTARLQPPSAEHWLGTDQLGRDLLTRLAHGGVYTVGAAVAITAVCVVVGVIAALGGSWVSQVGDALNAAPAVLVGLILAGTLGASLSTAALAVIVVGWIPLAAHGATVVAEAKATGFYRWAASQGASRTRLVVVHVLPMLVPAVVRHGASRVAHNALAIAGLGFLGLGAAHDSPEWGVVLAESFRYAERAPWFMAAPTVLLIAVGVVSAVATDGRIRLPWGR